MSGTRPFRLGLTGSIGMGKSTVARMFARERIPVFDADATVRTLQGPGGAALPAIEAVFPGVVGSAGLDRAALATRVFGDPAALRRLEAIMHPLVACARARFLARHARARAVVFDVPLLFETGGDAYCDGVAVVSAPARVQRARVLLRPGMNLKRFAAIRAAQWSDAAKRARSDFVIPTGHGRRATRAATRGLARALVRVRRLPGDRL